jgi:hypothetical protein
MDKPYTIWWSRSCVKIKSDLSSLARSVPGRKSTVSDFRPSEGADPTSTPIPSDALLPWDHDRHIGRTLIQTRVSATHRWGGRSDRHAVPSDVCRRDQCEEGLRFRSGEA